MGRPQTKSELLSAACEEFDRLWSAVAPFGQEASARPGVSDAWSLKNVLAHFDAVARAVPGVGGRRISRREATSAGKLRTIIRQPFANV
jgi:hypothetical protein